MSTLAAVLVFGGCGGIAFALCLRMINHYVDDTIHQHVASALEEDFDDAVMQALEIARASLPAPRVSPDADVPSTL